MRQSSVITDKKAQGQQPVGLLGHAAVRTHPSHAVAAGMDSDLRTLTHDHGYNFANIPVRAPAPSAPANYATPACPAFPRRCPFGGACHTCPVTVQAKLRVNQPGDSYEQEADRMAERVMRMPEPLNPTRSTSSTFSSIPPNIHTGVGASGQPLDVGTRAFMEPRFGHDFSNVRIHTDDVAAESALALNAKAYTLGRDIVFGTNQYAPRTAQGDNLIAHELAHVIQQNTTPGVQTIQRRLIVEGPNDPLPGTPPRVARDDVIPICNL